MRYAKSSKAMVLVYSKQTKVPDGIFAHNMGEVKGKTFERVLIFPTRDMRDWLLDHSSSLADASRAKLYVAIARARLSVAFVVSDDFDPVAAPFGFWRA